MPELIFVDSSNIEAIGYDDDTQELHVQFLSSGYYVYSDVPREVFDDLMNSPSKGSFLNREVKSIYQFTKQ
ncbi:MAG: KTSC domain-containing protein [Proteobacteria bacterium]|nr:KTSC domain-containing protein [Pseudomonadota bacterium]